MTIGNIVRTLHAMADQWIKISIMLEVPDNVVNSILVSRLKDEASLRRVIEWWFKNTSNPVWNIIQVRNLLQLCHFFVHDMSFSRKFNQRLKWNLRDKS